jgi:hypothetical protein
MKELKEIAIEITNLWQDLVEPKIIPRRMSPLEKAIWAKLEGTLPEKDFGVHWIKSRRKIHKALENLEKWWEDEYEDYEYMVLDGVGRVLEGAKEDLADEQDKEPEEIGEEDLDDEELYQWWPQEWSHNLADKHWLAKLVDRTRMPLDLQDVKSYGLEDAVLRAYVEPFKGDGDDLIKDLKDILYELEQKVDKHHIMKWAWDEEEEPFTW